MNAPAESRHSLYRLSERGWFGGVCAGLADRFTLDLTAIRIIVVVLTVGTGGLAGLVYLVAWAALPVAGPGGLALDTGSLGATAGDGSGADGGDDAAGSWGWRRRRSGRASGDSRIRRPRNGAIRLGLGVTLITLGVLLGFRELGFLWSDAIVWPIVIAAGGAALVLRQIQVSRESVTDDEPAEEEAPKKRRSALRLYRGGFGIALILLATTLFLYANGVFGEVSDAALVVLAISAAIGLILTPVLMAMARRAQEERRQRIRSEERAEVAAHLHDSVLQTLAMIQRRSGDSAEIATLARRQERELREWLSGRGDAERATSLAAALEETAAEVEESHQVPVEAVTVGDLPLDRRSEALVGATREAITNAVRFAGPESESATPGTVSVFAELSPERATVFIRDRGQGFDLDAVPPDRRGVRESIIGRMERHGGKATIRSRPGEGTEVELTMEFS